MGWVLTEFLNPWEEKSGSKCGNLAFNRLAKFALSLLQIVLSLETDPEPGGGSEEV